MLCYLWPWIRDKRISMPCPSWGTIFWLRSIPSWWTTSLSWDTEEIWSSVLQAKAMPPWCICLLQSHKPSGALLCYPRIQKTLLQIMQPYYEHATWMIWHKSENMQYNTTHHRVQQYLTNCRFVNRRFPIYTNFIHAQFLKPWYSVSWIHSSYLCKCGIKKLGGDCNHKATMSFRPYFLVDCNQNTLFCETCCRFMPSVLFSQAYTHPLQKIE